ncbi:MAG: hypothetical protein SPE87_00820, partial [Treponema porcinum]|uniref:hypothetical protein n=1 Tax=Treponema porcinum TaxID=261392 RepID=UPI0023555873
LVSVLCVQPTSIGRLCKEIIEIFRLRRECGLFSRNNLKENTGAVQKKGQPLYFACQPVHSDGAPLVWHFCIGKKN